MCCGCIRFWYLPVDFKSQANLGYAFVNMLNHEHVVPPFWRALGGFADWTFSPTTHGGSLRNEKVDHVEWNKIQELDVLIERFRNILYEVPEDHKPLLLLDGVETTFPKPTKQVKAPRIRKPPLRGAKKSAKTI